MTSALTLRSVRGDLARLVLPLAVLVVMGLFAAYETPEERGAEGAYLAFLAASVLLTVGALAPPPALELAMGGVLAAGILWILPTGPTRGATVVALLAVSLAVAGWRHWRGNPERLSLAGALPLAVGLQLLVRAENLLSPDLGILPSLLLLPALAALATLVLSWSQGVQGSLLAAAVSFLMGPGWTGETTLTLVVLAAGGTLWQPGLSWRWRVGTVLALLFAVVWDPWTGSIQVLAALALDERRKALWAAAVGALVLALAGTRRPWEECLGLVSWIFLLLPVTADPKAVPWRKLSLALLLAVAAARWSPAEGALTAPLGLLALSLRSREAVIPFQRAWLLVLLASTILTASYPWFRPKPLVEALGLVGLEPGWPGALILATTVLLASAACRGVAGRRRTLQIRRAWSLLPWILLWAACLAAVPSPPHTLLFQEAVILAPDRPRWVAELEPFRPTALAVESSLANAAALPAGTQVAAVRLYDRQGLVTALVLAAGRDTGEWAARREDVAGHPDLAVPAPWIAWVARDGTFFGQRYRRVWQLSGTSEIVRVEVERSPRLPGEVLVNLSRVDLR